MRGILAVSLLVGLSVNAFGFLPESITEVSKEDSTPVVNFTLYTRKHGNDGLQIFLGDKESIKRAGFNSKLPVVLSTHGYLSNACKESVQGFRRAFLAKGDVNFIAVDWSKHSNYLLYEKAALATKPVGLHVSKFIRFLTGETGLKIKDFHILGHSLGAHVFSFASNAFPNEKIGRITGLDPAAPLLEKLPPSDRLDCNDAHVVDVVHTCTVFLGVRKPIGTLDFYPNGGFGQPGCIKADLTCHHGMSYRFFAHAVQRGKDYEAVKCDTLKDAEGGNCKGKPAPMGLGSKKAEPGIYYLKIDDF